MSLFETSLIKILNQLSSKNMILDPNLHRHYVDIINQYSVPPKEAFIRSVTNNYFMLADYFLAKIRNKTVAILDAVQTQAFYNNMKGIEYLISKFNEDDWRDFYNYALIGATKSKNMLLIEQFLAQNAMADYGLETAIKIKDRELIQFFIERGANDFQRALETAVSTNNLELIEYFLSIIGPNVSYSRPLQIALYNSYIELVGMFLSYEEQKYPFNDTVVVLGPVLKLLVDNLSIKTRSNNDYSNWFPMLNQGYISQSVLDNILLLYLYQNHLVPYFPIITEPIFILDDFLKDILTNYPALYDINSEDMYEDLSLDQLIDNIDKKNSLDVIIPGFDSSTIVPITPVFALQIANIVHNICFINYYRDVPFDPQIIDQVNREAILIKLILQTY